jgi:hypothetical protein
MCLLEVFSKHESSLLQSYVLLLDKSDAWEHHIYIVIVQTTTDACRHVGNLKETIEITSWVATN